MRTFLTGARQRVYGAIDLGIDFATLGEYGLEQTGESVAASCDHPPASCRRRTAPEGRPALFDRNSLAA